MLVRLVGLPPKNVGGQGWPETSAHGRARSGFWEANPLTSARETFRLGQESASEITQHQASITRTIGSPRLSGIGRIPYQDRGSCTVAETKPQDR